MKRARPPALPSSAVPLPPAPASSAPGVTATLASSPPPPPPLAWRIVTALALVALTLAVFAGVRRNGWILFDDPVYVTDNVHVNHGVSWEGLRWFMTEPHVGNWHPVTSLAHMGIVQLFGLAPAAHHVASLLLHALNALLLLLALFRLTRSWWKSAIVAALFAVHPLRVESVAWASELKDVLSTCFFLLTLLAYARWCERPGAARQALVVGLLALGLLAKPMLVTAPAVLLLLDAWPLGRLASARELPARVREKWPLWLLVAVFVVITVLIQKKAGAVATVGHVTVPMRVTNALVSWWRYVGASFWPHGLTIYYPHPRRVLWLAGALAGAGLAAATALAWRFRGRAPWLATGWLWYVGTLVPVIGLVQVGRQAWADRYSYIPTIGLALALVWGVGALVERARAARIAAIAAALLAVGALSAATVRQVARWRDTRSLFGWTLQLMPENSTAHMCIGNQYMVEGRAREAVNEFREALRIEPDYDEVHNNLAAALASLGRFAEARVEFAAALTVRPNVEAWHNVGYMDAQQGRFDDAVREFGEALKLDPRHVPTLYALAAAEGARGRTADAEANLRRALDVDPNHAPSHRLLAETLKNERKPDEALEHYEWLLRADRDDVDALVNAAWLRATLARADRRDGAKALAYAERAKAKSPEPVAIIEATLAAACAEQGRFPEAIAAAERAVALARAAHSDGEAAAYASQLARYRAGQPLRIGS